MSCSGEDTLSAGSGAGTTAAPASPSAQHSYTASVHHNQRSNSRSSSISTSRSSGAIFLTRSTEVASSSNSMPVSAGGLLHSSDSYSTNQQRPQHGETDAQHHCSRRLYETAPLSVKTLRAATINAASEKKAHGSTTHAAGSKSAASSQSRRRWSSLKRVLSLAVVLTVVSMVYYLHFSLSALVPDTVGGHQGPKRGTAATPSTPSSPVDPSGKGTKGGMWPHRKSADLATLPWSVLVQHDDAAERLPPLPSSQPPKCKLFHIGCYDNTLSPTVLPSWTLRVVNPNCADCADATFYEEAVAHVPASNGSRAVFASASAPLGRIGPMLLAMASVTKAVKAETEMPKWSWMRHTSHGVPRSSERGKARVPPPYLAVMGIPSTDQLGRKVLRDAQRETWLSYSEVAKAANGFDGALLPLYLIAGVERAATAAAAAKRGKSPSAFQYIDSSQLNLSRDDYVAVSAIRAGGNYVGTSYTLPRIALRDNWQSAEEEEGHNPPCAYVYQGRMDGGSTRSGESDPLVYLGEELGLPVTPAFVSVPNYICYASAALWKEALMYRNFVWVDMLADRRPTTDKKLGENKKWGFPVEVGMSQKLILWLEYAYHAFPDVPYIMKGDDDAYVKVPQFLNDVRFVVRNDGASGLQRTQPYLIPPGDAPIEPNASVCTYWGSTRSVRGVRFNAGMHFMLHRYLIRALLEPPLPPAPQPSSPAKRTASTASPSVSTTTTTAAGATAVAVGANRFPPGHYIRLAVTDYTAALSGLFRRASFDREDVMLGFLLYDRVPRQQELCRHRKVFYVKESFTRMHDLRVGRVRNVTWASVVVHRCRPTDFHFLHYYYHNEYRWPVAGNLTLGEREAAVRNVVTAWAEQQALKMPQFTTWGDLPDTQLVFNGRGATPWAYTVGAADAVAVYAHKYNDFNTPRFRVYDGYSSDP